MNVIANHNKKDPSVLQSQRFGLTATSFSNEGSGVAERSIAGFLLGDKKENTDNKEDEGMNVLCGSKNAAIDWNYELGSKQEEKGLDVFVSKPFVMKVKKEQQQQRVEEREEDGEGREEQEENVKNAAIDWSYDVKGAKRAKNESFGPLDLFVEKKGAVDWGYSTITITTTTRTEKEGEKSVADWLREVQTLSEQCPMCDVFVSKASIVKHVNKHLEEEREGEKEEEKNVAPVEEKTKKKTKKKRRKGLNKAIEEFFK
jgi:hypothetical protein